MYRLKDKKQQEFKNFVLPFGGTLNPKNWWIQLAHLIPWEEFEEKYTENFSDEEKGAPAKPFRVALGSLLIKEKLNITDRETVQHIREIPHLQYLERVFVRYARKRVQGEVPHAFLYTSSG